MYKFPIGVIIDSFRCEFNEGIKKAVACGADGIQMYAVSGEFSPENFTPGRRKEILDIVKSNGLVFSALCGDLGQGFGDESKNPALIEKSKRIIELAKDLETDIVTTHIGIVPNVTGSVTLDKSIKTYEVMQKACSELGRYADSLNAYFALETGPERSDVLKEFLDSLGTKGLSVNFDPANLVMVMGERPVPAVYNLKDYIVHTHAKDGIKLSDKSPEEIYGKNIENEVRTERAFKELPLGEGDVDFDSYLKALDDIGYKGFLTIERECGANPARDIENAVKFLRDRTKN